MYAVFLHCLLKLDRLFFIAVKTTESILSAVTTGWLSHLSDRSGRKGILALSMFGALFMSVTRSRNPIL